MAWKRHTPATVELELDRNTAAERFARATDGLKPGTIEDLKFVIGIEGAELVDCPVAMARGGIRNLLKRLEEHATVDDLKLKEKRKAGLREVSGFGIDGINVILDESERRGIGLDSARWFLNQGTMHRWEDLFGNEELLQGNPGYTIEARTRQELALMKTRLATYGQSFSGRKATDHPVLRGFTLGRPIHREDLSVQTAEIEANWPDHASVGTSTVHALLSVTRTSSGVLPLPLVQTFLGNDRANKLRTPMIGLKLHGANSVGWNLIFRD